MGSGQIEVLNPRPNVEILEMMSRAMLLVLPSRCEGTPCVILEAMASGLPIIASDVGGIPALVRDGENGFLVPVEDVSALEDRLRTLLRDKALRERMGATSYQMAHSEFAEEMYRQKFTQMVRDVVELRQGGK
jgi:glycosyltransferase involved in cell wall biosynthesis